MDSDRENDAIFSFCSSITQSLFRVGPVIGSAEDAIERYSKAIDNVKGETELMVFFVECGNNFTLSYGDIDDDFYDSVLLMYEKAIQNVTELSPEEQKVFKERLHEIMDSASGIGWGYHDGLRELYYESFPDDH